MKGQSVVSLLAALWKNQVFIKCDKYYITCEWYNKNILSLTVVETNYNQGCLCPPYQSLGMGWGGCGQYVLGGCLVEIEFKQ